MPSAEPHPLDESTVAPRAPAGADVPRWMWLSMAGLVLVAVGAVAWLVVTAQEAGRMHVAWSGDPQCTGAAVSPAGSAGSAGSEGDPAVIRARRGMECTITVAVRNDTSRTVRLERSILPYLAGGGAVVRAVPGPAGSGPAGSGPAGAGPSAGVLSAPRPGDVDAVLGLDADLAAGDSLAFTIRIGFDDSGCAAGRTTVSDWPTVVVRILGRSVEVPADDDLSFIQAGPSRRCPSP